MNASFLLSITLYLIDRNSDNLDWFDSAKQALILLLPHVSLLSLWNQLETVIPWLHELGCDFI